MLWSDVSWTTRRHFQWNTMTLLQVQTCSTLFAFKTSFAPLDWTRTINCVTRRILAVTRAIQRTVFPILTNGTFWNYKYTSLNCICYLEILMTSKIDYISSLSRNKILSHLTLLLLSKWPQILVLAYLCKKKILQELLKQNNICLHFVFILYPCI